MSHHKLTTLDFQESLKEQLFFLKFSIASYPENEIEAKRIATSIRILIHDTNNSTSLLVSLGQKYTIVYIDSAAPNDGKLHSMTGMVGVTKSNENQYFGLIGKIKKNTNLVAVPLFLQHNPTLHKKYSSVSFDTWWESEILKKNGVGLTRRELILNITNKDGGAHIDTSLPQKYHNIKNSPLKLIVQGHETQFDRNIIYASAAQVGWELLHSIKSNIQI